MGSFPNKATQFSKDNQPKNRGDKKGVEHSKTRLKRLLALTENMKNPVTGELEEFSVIEQMDLALIIRARKGDVKAYNSILDRLEGKPNQAVKYEGKLETTNKYDELTEEDLDRAREAIINDMSKNRKSSGK